MTCPLPEENGGRVPAHYTPDDMGWVTCGLGQVGLAATIGSNATAGTIFHMPNCLYGGFKPSVALGAPLYPDTSSQLALATVCIKATVSNACSDCVVTSTSCKMSKFEVLLVFGFVFLFSAASGLIDRKCVGCGLSIYVGSQSLCKLSTRVV